MKPEQTKGVPAGSDGLTLLGDFYAGQNLTAQAIASYEKVQGAERARDEEKLLQFAGDLQKPLDGCEPPRKHVK